MDKRVFSTTLHSLRKEKKVTQEQLAERLGVSPQAVSNGKMEAIRKAI